VDWTAAEDEAPRMSTGISDAMLQAFRTLFSLMLHINATRSSRPWNFTLKNVTLVILMHVVPEDVLKYHRQQHKNLSNSTTLWTAAEVSDFWYDIIVSRSSISDHASRSSFRAS